MIDSIMMYLGYIVFGLFCLFVIGVLLEIAILSMEQWKIFNPKQKFALFPKRVLNMKSKDHYYHGLIWLCWYWDTGEEQKSNTKYYRLTDEEEPPMEWHRFTRTYTNSW